MRTTAFGLGLTALLVMGGCRNEPASSTSHAAPDVTTTSAQSASAIVSPEELGKIGAKIRKQPADANKILSEHGMTEASFEKAIRSVSSDPAASRRYRDAYNKAGA